MTEVSTATPPRPQDDLFRHVNGQWLATTTIPADHSMWGAFHELRDTSLQRCRSLIEACDAHDEDHDSRCIARLWQAFMDTETIEHRGVEDIRPTFAAIAAATSKAELAGLLGQLQREGVGGWLEPEVIANPREPAISCTWMLPSGLSLPDEAYYREAAHEPIRQAFIAHVRRMLTLAGLPSPQRAAGQIFEVERTFARFHLDAVRSRDVDLIVNVSHFDDLIAASSGFDWRAWERGLGASLTTLNVTWPSFAVAGARWWSQMPIGHLQSWMSWRVLTRYAAYLPAAFVEEDFAFYSHTLAGVDEMRERWKRGVSVIESHLGFALGRRYVKAHFPASSREMMEGLVDNLLEAYAESISSLEWMGDETRESALTKLQAFRTKIGYPASARTYDDVTFAESDSLIDLVRTSARATSDFEAAKIDKPVDRDEWYMTPQTVNAYYMPTANEIVFPAAILEPPFFSPEASPAQNYGGIGAVIGHEIGHGFDDQGAKFDGEGRVSNWWSDDDFAQFQARTRALIAQYDAYVPEGLEADEHVNGALTIGENIGDLGGLSIALKAWQIARKKSGEGDPSKEDLREFFFQWARIWRGKARTAYRRQLLATDPHSPDEFRCNGVVRNMDAFHEVFATSAGDDLWLDPDERVTIW